MTQQEAVQPQPTRDERVAFVLEKRQLGWTYERIGKALAALGGAITKQRVKEIVKVHRPDLMGSRSDVRKRIRRAEAFKAIAEQARRAKEGRGSR